MSCKIDLHLHSTLSPDGSISQKDIQKIFDSGALDVIAVTDHNEVSEAQRLQGIFGDKIIVGEEIKTTKGEIIGLFLKEKIPSGLSPGDTIKAIHSQGGLVYIPHPFERVRKGLPIEVLDSISNQIDCIEVINGRAWSRRYVEIAMEWSSVNKVPAVASSDAHGPYGWGRVYTVIEEYPTKDNLVAQLRKSMHYGKSLGIRARTYPRLNKLRKIFLKG